MERKFLTSEIAKLSTSEEKPLFFSGYASVFGGVDSYKDTIIPGAYRKSLEARAPIRMHYQHNQNVVVGKWLNIKEDDIGLYAEGELTPNHSLANDIAASMRHGTISGLSIGYYIPEGGSQKENGIRKLTEIDLKEISVVVNPADSSALIDAASIKSVVEEAKSLAEIEDWLRDTAGFSRSAATQLVSKINRILRESERIDAENLKKAFEKYDFSQFLGK